MTRYGFSEYEWALMPEYMRNIIDCEFDRELDEDEKSTAFYLSELLVKMGFE